jgi:hypothetical protein
MSRPIPASASWRPFVNPAAASEAGAGYTRIILRWDVIQPGGPIDWKPANVPDPLLAGELAAGREVVGLLIGTPDWAAAPGQAPGSRAVPDMAAWEAFTRRMAQHYQGRIRQLGDLERARRVDGGPPRPHLGWHGGRTTPCCSRPPTARSRGSIPPCRSMWPA